MKLRLGIVAVAVAVAIALATLLSMGHGSASHATLPVRASGNVVTNHPMTGRYGSPAPTPTASKLPSEPPPLGRTPRTSLSGGGCRYGEETERGTPIYG